jgi:hypothetical protein
MSSHSPRRRTIVSSRSSGHYHCESLEQRVLLSRLGDFVAPMPLAAPSDPLVAHQAGRINTTSYPEYRDLSLLAQSTTAAQQAALDHVDGPLLVLYSRALQKKNVPLTREPFTGGTYADFFNVTDDGTRPIVQAFVKDVTTARPALEQMGMHIIAVTDTASWQVVCGELPVGAIGAAASSTPGLVHLSAVERPELNQSGAATNQWETVSLADQLKRNLGIDGTNIDVGIMSDSINRVGTGVAGSQASGDLPPGARVTVLKDGPASGATDEGRAMSELVYDMGSGFDLLYYTAFVSPADMAAGFTSLRANGADVIADDVSWLGEPFFQDGQIAQSIDTNVNAGTLCFTCASNQEDSSYEHAWQNPDADSFYDFSAGDEALGVSLSNGEQIRLGLQWNQPFNNASSDLDVQIWNSTLTTMLADTNTNNIGGAPFDFMSFTNTTGGTASFFVVIQKVSGPDPSVLKFISFNNADDFTENYVLDQPGIPGNNAPNLGFTIGAVFSGTPDSIESYSSRGPNTIYFNSAGVPIAPVARQKPEFTAADGCATNVPGFATFFGTSAASPNAAAIAGLMLQAHGGAGSLTRAQVFDIFRATAVGTNAGGSWNAVHGFGRISGLGAGMVADGRLGVETYLELNQFGDATSTSTLASNADIDSVAWASDDSGTTTVTVTESATPFDTAETIWNVESNSFIDIDYDTIGQQPQVSFGSSFWTRYEADIFNQANIATAGTYTITVNGPDQFVAALALNTTGSASTNSFIDAIQDPDFYSVTAPATSNGLLTVSLTPAAALDAVVSLYSSTGVLLARADGGNAGGAENISFSGVTPGVSYDIRVASFAYASSGAYTLNVSFGQPLPVTNTTIETVMVPFGPTGSSIDTYAGDIGVEGIGDIDYDVFGGDNSVGSTFTITATAGAGSAVDPVMAIYDASTGALVAFDLDSGAGNAAQINFTATSGVRYILAVGDQQSDSTGGVDVTATYGSTFAGQALPLDASGNASIGIILSPVTDSDFYSFTTPAAGLVGTGTVTLTPNAPLAGDVFVFDGAGQRIGSDFNNAAGAVATASLSGLAPSTTYYITINPSQYNSSGTGTLAVNVAVIGAPTAPDLAAASDLGISTTDNITKDNTPTFNGVALAGATVRLYRGATLVGSIVADGLGNWSITPAAQPDGTFNFDVTQQTGASESEHSAALGVTIDTVAPTILAPADFNYQTGPQNLAYRFSENVGPSLGAADMTLKDTTHGVGIPTSVAYNAGLNVGVFTWPTAGGGTGILPDANFAATIGAAGVTDIAGNALPADNVANFFFLQGDANHDRKVDVTDLGILATNWQGAPRNFTQADFNYDTHVDVSDLGILATQWQHTLPASPAPPVSRGGPTLVLTPVISLTETQIDQLPPDLVQQIKLLPGDLMNALFPKRDAVEVIDLIAGSLE